MGLCILTFPTHKLTSFHFISGLGGKASRHQDERTFLFPKSPLHRHGTTKHQLVRVDQGKRLRRVYDCSNSSIHESDVTIANSHAPSSHSSLWFEAWGKSWKLMKISVSHFHCHKNVLLRHPAKSGLKVIDFGSSCLEHEKSMYQTIQSSVPHPHWWDPVYTYIQSRFYRSPEVILGMNYHMAIDMWSLGCILAELYTGFPIFPGENEQEQLSCIMEVLGIPDKEFVNRSSRRKLFFGMVRTTLIFISLTWFILHIRHKRRPSCGN